MAEWAKDLAAKRKAVLHTQNNVVGKAVRFYSGMPGDEAISAITSTCVKGPVLELDNGHTFVVKDSEDFRVLTEEEYRFYLIANSALAHGIRESIKLAASMHNVGKDIAIALVRTILAAQINAIRKA